MYFSHLFLFIFAMTGGVVGWGLFGVINKQRFRIKALCATLSEVLPYTYAKCSCKSGSSPPCESCEVRYRACLLLQKEEEEEKRLED